MTRLVITGAIVAAAFWGRRAIRDLKWRKRAVCGAGRDQPARAAATLLRRRHDRHLAAKRNRLGPAPRTPARRAARRIVPLPSREVGGMGPGLDDQSRDSIDSQWPCRDFSMLRARKRELLDEQRSRWVRGPPAPARGADGPVAHQPGQRPGRRQPAPGRLSATAAAGRRDQPGGIRAALSRAEADARRATRARKPPSARLGERATAGSSPSACPTWGTRSSASACACPSGKGRSAGCSWRSRPTWPAALSCSRSRPSKGTSPRRSPSCCTPTSSRSIRSTRISARACVPSACPTWEGRASRPS